ncbi:MAG TPA: hypothetical protein ENG99_00710 [bacterium]|nr:hypothetical protein [bacterium]
MFQLKGDEVSVRAEPFFFSFPKKGKEFSFNWAINGKKIKTEKPNVVNLRVNKNRESGQSTITLNAKNLFREFQFANNNFMVNFGQ